MPNVGVDLSRSPYFDDFDANAQHQQVLFRPGVAVQTREMNVLQSILQDQISKFGRNIFKEGSIVEGCSFTFDNRYPFVKINDNYSNGTAFTISNFKNLDIMNANGLRATIVDTVAGYQSQDPDTNVLYIKYLNSATFSNGQQQTVFSNSEQLTIATSENVFIGNVTVLTPNVANPNSISTGIGYALFTSSGTIFKGGYFLQVDAQNIIVDKYNNVPDGISVGFSLAENIITPEANNSLYDNAGGSPNYAAPGAHRFKIISSLQTMQTNNISNTTSFFSICDFQSGVPVTIKTDPQYSIIGAEMARRTYETNGDFVVSPFILTTEPKNSSDPLFSTYDNLVSSLGTAYVKGYRNEFLASVTTPLKKAINYDTFLSSVTTASFGMFVYVNNFCGDFDLSNLSEVELHLVNNYAVSNNTFLNTTYTSNTLIGYGYLRGFSYNSGQTGSGSELYNAYLFNIQMIPGTSFSQVKSIIYRPSTNILGIADVIQDYIPKSNTYGTILKDPSENMMIFPIGQKALKLDGFQNQSYTYRKRANSSFSGATGVMTITLETPVGSATENFDSGGYLSVGAQQAFIVVPTANGVSTNKSGTVNATSSNNEILGNSTSFLTDYSQGDFITINGYVGQISSISNNSSLILTLPYPGTTALTNVHSKAFISGVPISFNRSGRSINANGTVATFTLGDAISGTFNASAYFDILRSHASPIKKKLQRNVYVGIDCGIHPNGTKGSYSLGFSDVHNINSVYISNGVYSNTVSDSSYLFKFDNGQRDDRYNLASITPIASGILNTSSLILVDMDVFLYDQSQGVGYFTGNSYPVDDANVSNTSAIQTQYIPQYISSIGSTFDLRDCIDFRPFANNSANSFANSTNWNSLATINPSDNLYYNINSLTGSFLPSPDTNYISDIQYYLPRIDKAILTTGGLFSTITGIPAAKPLAPLDVATAMTLGIITVPPYPSLSTPDAKATGRYDYAVTISLTQNRRFTMANIGGLNDRVTQLEYYTTLNFLEQTAFNNKIQSSQTGQTRFQNGFLVDPFQGSNIADTLDPTFNCAIDPVRQEMRPAFSTFTKAMWTDMENVPFNENQYIYQNFSSIAINATSCIWNYLTGRIELRPQLICSPDYFQDPDVVNNLDLNSNWINISCRPNPDANDWRSPYGTDWEHWRHYPPIINNTQTASGNTDSYGNALTAYQSTTTSNVAASGLILNSNSNYNSNGITIDTDVIDFVRCRDIDFIARGLKPSTTVRLFVGAYELSNLCRQCSKGFAEETFANYGSSIISDSTGTIFGRITIPAGYFKEGSIQFTFLDNPSNITTRADGYLQTSFIDSNNWKDIDVSDQVSDYERASGVSPQYLPGQTLVTIANTPFLYNRQQGATDQVQWNTYFNSVGNTNWKRFPSHSITINTDNDWNATYVAQDGFHSFDRKGSDVGRISSIAPQTDRR
jgi:hypothetical protein